MSWFRTDSRALRGVHVALISGGKDEGVRLHVTLGDDVLREIGVGPEDYYEVLWGQHQDAGKVRCQPVEAGEPGGVRARCLGGSSNRARAWKFGKPPREPIKLANGGLLRFARGTSANREPVGHRVDGRAVEIALPDHWWEREPSKAAQLVVAAPAAPAKKLCATCRKVAAMPGHEECPSCDALRLRRRRGAA